MSDGSSYADLVILGLLAVFILLRLRSILGDKVGNDGADYFKKMLPPAVKQQSQAQEEPIVQLEEKSFKIKFKDEDPYLSSLKDRQVADVLESIKEKDLQFTATSFLHGAKLAYEMVFDAFAKGDRKTLGMLLSETTFAAFSNELDIRESSENKTETTLVSVVPKDIVAASMNGSMARLTVKFDSEHITVVRDAKGGIVEGDPSELHIVDDQWIFERDITSKNPNWKIIET
jgi:predicted lipid-binding transport protein (Tim44 family)